MSARKTKSEQNEYRSPQFIRATILSLTERASQGDETARRNLEKYLKDYPALRPAVGEVGALMDQSEDKWIKMVACDNADLEAATRKEIASIKAELLGEKPTIVEKVLVSTLVTAYLSNQRAVRAAAEPPIHPSVEAMRNRRVESTQRRLLAAMRAWQIHGTAKLKGKGSLPQTLKIFRAMQT